MRASWDIEYFMGDFLILGLPLIVVDQTPREICSKCKTRAVSCNLYVYLNPQVKFIIHKPICRPCYEVLYIIPDIKFYTKLIQGDYEEIQEK